MEKISVSELQRNLHRLDENGIVEIVDKKRSTVKGYFIGSGYADYVAEMSERIEKERGEKGKAAGILHAYADAGRIEGEKAAWRDHVVARYAEERSS